MWGSDGPSLADGSSASAEVHSDEIVKILTETDVYVKYGLHQKAVTHLQRIFELDAENIEAKERLTFEYLLIRDFNDALADADALVRLLARLPAKINLIPMNPDPVLDAGLRPPPAARVRAFRQRLKARGMVATIRKRVWRISWRYIRNCKPMWHVFQVGLICVTSMALRCVGNRRSSCKVNPWRVTADG